MKIAIIENNWHRTKPYHYWWTNWQIKEFKNTEGQRTVGLHSPQLSRILN